MRAKKVESTKYVSEQTSQSSGWSVEVAATASARSSVLTAATRLGDSVAQNVEDGREIRGELMAAQVAAEATQLVTADTAAVALSAGISADFDSSHSRSTSQNTQYLGGNLSIEATEGDATLVGAKFGGGDQVSLKAAKNVNLMAAESTFESHSESHNFHASADANLGANAVQGAVGLGLTAGMGTSHQITNETGKTYAGTSVDAANVSIDAGKDLNLSGSRVRVSTLSWMSRAISMRPASRMNATTTPAVAVGTSRQAWRFRTARWLRPWVCRLQFQYGTRQFAPDQ